MSKKTYVKPESKLFIIPPGINMSDIDIDSFIEQDIEISGTEENDRKLQDGE